MRRLLRLSSLSTFRLFDTENQIINTFFSTAVLCILLLRFTFLSLILRFNVYLFIFERFHYKNDTINVTQNSILMIILHRLLRCFAFQSQIRNRWTMQRGKIVTQKARILLYAGSSVILHTSRLHQSPA